MKKNVLLILLCSFVVIYFLCKKNNKQNVASNKKTFVATTNIIADALKNIVKDHATVHQLMGPGIDPHLYKARESDVHKLAEADMVFYNGLHLEGKMCQLLEGMHRFTKTIAVTDSIDKTELRTVDFEDMYDPHVWFDVLLWIRIVRYMQQKLIEYDHENAHIYAINGDAYLQELEDTHKYIQECINKISPTQRVLITAHDAFGYFGRSYGFDVIGLQGLSTDADINTKDIADLADLIVAKKIRSIFIESSIPQRSIIAVQNAVLARGWLVEIGDELYSDALGDLGTDAGSYSGMIKYNVDTIVCALGE